MTKRKATTSNVAMSAADNSTGSPLLDRLFTAPNLPCEPSQVQPHELSAVGQEPRKLSLFEEDLRDMFPNLSLEQIILLGKTH